MTRNPRFEEKCKFTVEHVRIFYPKITESYMDDYEGKLRYKLTMEINKDLAAKMEEAGFNVKYDENGQAFLDAIRNHKLKSGETMPPPQVVFEDGTVWNPEVHGFLGNETLCDVVVSAKYTKVGKEWRLPCYLDKIIIKELVAYEGASAPSASDVF